jgi:HlyD family secretion protein
MVTRMSGDAFPATLDARLVVRAALPGMTANVQIITGQKENALRVPNAALRFRPRGVEIGQVQSRTTGPVAAQGSGPRAARAPNLDWLDKSGWPILMGSYELSPSVLGSPTGS